MIYSAILGVLEQADSDGRHLAEIMHDSDQDNSTAD